MEASEPLHVLVLRQRQGEQTVLASRFVEWRKVLVHGKLGKERECVNEMIMVSHGLMALIVLIGAER